MSEKRGRYVVIANENNHLKIRCVKCLNDFDGPADAWAHNANCAGR